MNHRRLIRLIIACGILFAGGVLLQGYVTDDTFIHLRYAQHLLTRGEFSFNPGVSTYGATSPLWIVGLVALLELGLAPLTAAWVLGLIAGLLMLFLFDAILARLPWPPWWRAVLLWLAASDAWFVRWTWSGMETPLATALLLVLLLPLFGQPAAARSVRWRVFLAWGGSAALAGLVRPEFILLAPLAWPWLLWHESRVQPAGTTRWPRLVLASLVGWLVVLGPWLLFSYRVFGHLLPGTASAKSYALTVAPDRLVASGLRSLQQLAATQGTLWLALLGLTLAFLLLRAWRRTQTNTKTNDGTDQIPGGEVACWSTRQTALVGITVTWCLALMGGYAVKQVWVISRYLAPLAPPLLLALGVVAHWFWTRGRGRGCLADTWFGGTVWRWVCTVCLGLGCVVCLAVNGWLLVSQVRPHAQDFSRGVNDCYLGIGEWLARESASDALVAALDIGAVGYASERRVLDLMGLVSPELIDLGHEIGFEEMVASGAWLDVERPDYLVDRTVGPPRWTDRQLKGVRFELLDTCIIEGVGLREPEPWTVALYRLVPLDPE
ncbi:MAG: hypothetical protein ABIF77_20590 [bacterium]